MDEINTSSFVSPSLSNHEAAKESKIGQDCCGRTYHKETSAGEAHSISRRRFGSQSTHLEKVDPLDKGIAFPLDLGKAPYQEAMKTVSKNVCLEDQDLAFARFLNQSVNPKQIPDGHCAKCAFNTYLYFMGRELQEAEEGKTEKFSIFSWWFYANCSPEVAPCIECVEGRKEESYDEYKKRVEERVQAHTTAGESVLISVGEGAHWYNAYNDGKRIWFFDSQTGKGFHLYGPEKSTFNESKVSVEIVKVTSKQIADYDSL